MSNLPLCTECLKWFSTTVLCSSDDVLLKVLQSTKQKKGKISKNVKGPEAGLYFWVQKF